MERKTEKEGKVLSYDDFKKPQQVKIEKVLLSDGRIAYIKEIMGRPYDLYQRALFDEVEVEEEDGKKRLEYRRTFKDFRAKLVAATLCDEKGNLIFDLEKDVEMISQNTKGHILDELYAAAQKLNKTDETSRQELAKNSEPGPSASDISQ